MRRKDVSATVLGRVANDSGVWYRSGSPGYEERHCRISKPCILAGRAAIVRRAFVGRCCWSGFLFWAVWIGGVPASWSVWIGVC